MAIKEEPRVVRTTDLKAFRSHCHLAARVAGAKEKAIKDLHDGFGVCSFAVASFEFSDGQHVALLLNVVYPVIAFAKCPVEGQIIFEYVDCPKLAADILVPTG